jgi:hypothetical protein
MKITGVHTTAIGDMPPIHKDPFDRILLAQAKCEGIEPLRVCQKISITSLDKEPSPDSKFLPRFWQKFTRRAKVTRYKLVILIF